MMCYGLIHTGLRSTAPSQTWKVAHTTETQFLMLRVLFLMVMAMTNCKGVI